MRKPRGVILSDHPGTRNTLIARAFCEMLIIHSKIVLGPEICDRFLRESEEKIRNLFAGARRDQDTLGNRSPLYIIICYESGPICKRGTYCDESRRDSVQNNVTTQLLAEVDGLQPIDNIFVIGTTNMLTSIEPALLRPGRTDVVVDVHLPNANARLHILNIYRKALLQNDPMELSVDIERIIRATHGFTGGYMGEIVRLAVINAMRHGVLSCGRLDISEEESENLRVYIVHLSNALFNVLSTEHGELLELWKVVFV